MNTDFWIFWIILAIFGNYYCAMSIYSTASVILLTFWLTFRGSVFHHNFTGEIFFTGAPPVHRWRGEVLQYLTLVASQKVPARRISPPSPPPSSPFLACLSLQVGC